MILIGRLFVLPLIGRQLGVDLHVLFWLIWPPIEAVFEFVVVVTGNG